MYSAIKMIVCDYDAVSYVHLTQLGCLPLQSPVQSVWFYWCLTSDLFLLQQSIKSHLYRNCREKTYSTVSKTEFTNQQPNISWSNTSHAEKKHTENSFGFKKWCYHIHLFLYWISIIAAPGVNINQLYLVMMARWGGAMQAPMKRITFSCLVCL